MFWILSALLGARMVLPAVEPFRIGNGSLTIEVSPEHGALVGLIDSTTGHNHLGMPPEIAGLWELEVVRGTEVRKLSPAQAKVFRYEPAGRGIAGVERGAAALLAQDSKSFPGTLRLCWEGFGLPAAPRLRVEVVVRMEQMLPVSRWSMRVTDSGGLTLRAVRFPRLMDLTPQPNELLAVPVWQGQQTAQARQLLTGTNGHGQRLEWSYPGQLSLQCLAFYAQPGSGLYVACDDTAAFRKAFACFGDGRGNISCELVHWPQNRGASAGDWSLPYQVLLGTFQGDWYTAAERYRAWATNQVWAAHSRLAAGKVPSWVRETGLWVWNRGRSGEVLAPALALEQHSGLPVNVFWHWWHGCAYDMGFPEYLPPREGTEPFKTALAAAHRQGLHALVYMNQRLWGTTTASWRAEGAEPFAVKGVDGKVHPEIYNTFTKAPCAAMCLGTKFWREKYAGLAEQAVRDLGVDGIYMDQACASLLCYDSTHGHPAGGGTYWMSGFRALAEDIRHRCGPIGKAEPRQPREQVALAGEGCGESWLPHLDLPLSLQVSQERYAGSNGWETIPFFQAVYHPYALTFGNYSSLTMPPYDELWPAEFAPKEPLRLLDQKFSRQFYLEQARAFVWGQQPTIANFLPAHLTQRPEEIEYVVRLARIRTQARKYLLEGTFLRPPQLHAPEDTLNISRLSIYAGQKGALKEYQRRVPLALAAAWRAPDGSVAIALASIAAQPLEVNLDLSDYGLPANATVYRIDETGRHRLTGMWPTAQGWRLTLKARDACLLEFAP